MSSLLNKRVLACWSETDKEECVITSVIGVEKGVFRELTRAMAVHDKCAIYNTLKKSAGSARKITALVASNRTVLINDQGLRVVRDAFAARRKADAIAFLKKHVTRKTILQFERVAPSKFCVFAKKKPFDIVLTDEIAIACGYRYATRYLRKALIVRSKSDVLARVSLTVGFKLTRYEDL